VARQQPPQGPTRRQRLKNRPSSHANPHILGQGHLQLNNCTANAINTTMWACLAHSTDFMVKVLFTFKDLKSFKGTIFCRFLKKQFDLFQGFKDSTLFCELEKLKFAFGS
jgi:hypothetical protein